MNERNYPGPGDEATWPPCVGHPGDPRTEYDDSAELLSETYWQAVDILEEAIEALDGDDWAAIAEALATDNADAVLAAFQEALAPVLLNMAEEAIRNEND